MAPSRPPRLIIGGATASCAKQEVNDVSLSPSNTKAISRARLAGSGVAFSIGPGVSSGLFSIWKALITRLPNLRASLRLDGRYFGSVNDLYGRLLSNDGLRGDCVA